MRAGCPPLPQNTMTASDFTIDPETKVAALLEHFPELEDVLIGIAPPFQKLKNPVLRRTVAKVASLRQAAAVAQLPVQDLVNTLRRTVGQAPLVAEGVSEDASYLTERPAWFDPGNVVRHIDADRLDPDAMPLKEVLLGVRQLEPTDILVLETSYIPAPGIDLLTQKGYKVWCTKHDENSIRTYVAR